MIFLATDKNKQVIGSAAKVLICIEHVLRGHLRVNLRMPFPAIVEANKSQILQLESGP